LRAGVYTPGQIDTRWTDEIEADFTSWLKANRDMLPVPKERVEEILQERE
jgi:hypothetical protein